MYLDHFGLKRPPFKITPDTSLFYTGNKRGAALQALKYAVESGEGIIKVIGEVGSGKTMLCRMLEQELAAHIEIVYLANPSLSPENILQVIAYELKLDINDHTNKLEVMRKLQAYLLKKHAENKQVLILVEEAQSMPIETLEEIRLLSNLETNDHKLLQMILFGQPELDEKLQLKKIRQLKERITHSIYLDLFSSADIYAYLNHRMHAVGYRGPDIFSSKVASSISKESLGLTRRINILADKALLAVYAEGNHDVYKKHIKIASEDSEFNRKERSYKQVKSISIIIVLMTLSVLFGMEISKNKVFKSEVININESSKGLLKEAEKISTEVKKIEFNEIDKQIINIADDRITIQLMLADDWGIKAFNKKYENKINKRNIYIYKIRLNNKEIYSVIYGDYKNKKIAREVLLGLPKELKQKGAYLRSFKGIKSDIRKSGIKAINIEGTN